MCSSYTYIPTWYPTYRNRPFDWSDSSSSGDEDPVGKAGIERCTLRAVQMKEEAGRDEDSWFLESLSENAALEQCHPDAVLFRCRFKAHRDQLVSRLFTVFNQELFARKVTNQKFMLQSTLIIVRDIGLLDTTGSLFWFQFLDRFSYAK